MRNVIIRPIITEKSLDLASRGSFTFQVHQNATKGSIAAEISDRFRVDVLDVQTITVHGKTKRVGRRRTPVKASSWKKAIVSLKKGQTIGLFEVKGEEG